MTTVLVEGDSDRIAVHTLAPRLGLPVPHIVAIGGAFSARRAAAGIRDRRLIGLVDRAEAAQFAGVVDEVFVCEPDLEGELIRAIGINGVRAVIEAQGEGASFERMQRQPAQRDRTLEAQLVRFFAGRSGNKARYAALLAEAVPIERAPAVLVDLLRATVI